MTKGAIALSLFILCAPVSSNSSGWRQATERELKSVIPARAAVEKERIETEMRTASGVISEEGKMIAGVVMITAGYAAEGKYSHFFVTQVAIRIGNMQLAPGQYVFGYKRVDNESLEVKFYEAANGNPVGVVKAHKDSKPGPVRSFFITPPNGGKAMIQIGRFAFEYNLAY
jgi:hypothetical protein